MLCRLNAWSQPFGTSIVATGKLTETCAWLQSCIGWSNRSHAAGQAQAVQERCAHSGRSGKHGKQAASRGGPSPAGTQDQLLHHLLSAHKPSRITQLLQHCPSPLSMKHLQASLEVISRWYEQPVYRSPSKWRQIMTTMAWVERRMLGLSSQWTVHNVYLYLKTCNMLGYKPNKASLDACANTLAAASSHPSSTSSFFPGAAQHTRKHARQTQTSSSVDTPSIQAPNKPVLSAKHPCEPHSSSSVNSRSIQIPSKPVSSFIPADATAISQNSAGAGLSSASLNVGPVNNEASGSQKATHASFGPENSTGHPSARQAVGLTSERVQNPVADVFQSLSTSSDCHTAGTLDPSPTQAVSTGSAHLRDIAAGVFPAVTDSSDSLLSGPLGPDCASLGSHTAGALEPVSSNTERLCSWRQSTASHFHRSPPSAITSGILSIITDASLRSQANLQAAALSRQQHSSSGMVSSKVVEHQLLGFAVHHSMAAGQFMPYMQAELSGLVASTKRLALDSASGKQDVATLGTHDAGGLHPRLGSSLFGREIWDAVSAVAEDMCNEQQIATTKDDKLGGLGLGFSTLRQASCPAGRFSDLNSIVAGDADLPKSALRENQQALENALGITSTSFVSPGAITDASKRLSEMRLSASSFQVSDVKLTGTMASVLDSDAESKALAAVVAAIQSTSGAVTAAVDDHAACNTAAVHDFAAGNTAAVGHHAAARNNTVALDVFDAFGKAASNMPLASGAAAALPATSKQFLATGNHTLQHPSAARGKASSTVSYGTPSGNPKPAQPSAAATNPFTCKPAPTEQLADMLQAASSRLVQHPGLWDALLSLTLETSPHLSSKSVVQLLWCIVKSGQRDEVQAASKLCNRLLGELDDLSAWELSVMLRAMAGMDAPDAGGVVHVCEKLKGRVGELQLGDMGTAADAILGLSRYWEAKMSQLPTSAPAPQLQSLGDVSDIVDAVMGLSAPMGSNPTLASSPTSRINPTQSVVIAAETTLLKGITSKQVLDGRKESTITQVLDALQGCLRVVAGAVSQNMNDMPLKTLSSLLTACKELHVIHEPLLHATLAHLSHIPPVPSNPHAMHAICTILDIAATSHSYRPSSNSSQPSSISHVSHDTDPVTQQKFQHPINSMLHPSLHPVPDVAHPRGQKPCSQAVLEKQGSIDATQSRVKGQQDIMPDVSDHVGMHTARLLDAGSTHCGASPGEIQGAAGSTCHRGCAEAGLDTPDSTAKSTSSDPVGTFNFPHARSDVADAALQGSMHNIPGLKVGGQQETRDLSGVSVWADPLPSLYQQHRASQHRIKQLFRGRFAGDPSTKSIAQMPGVVNSCTKVVTDVVSTLGGMLSAAHVPLVVTDIVPSVVTDSSSATYVAGALCARQLASADQVAADCAPLNSRYISDSTAPATQSNQLAWLPRVVIGYDASLLLAALPVALSHMRSSTWDGLSRLLHHCEHIMAAVSTAGPSLFDDIFHVRSNARTGRLTSTVSNPFLVQELLCAGEFAHSSASTGAVMAAATTDAYEADPALWGVHPSELLSMHVHNDCPRGAPTASTQHSKYTDVADPCARKAPTLYQKRTSVADPCAPSVASQAAATHDPSGLQHFEHAIMNAVGKVFRSAQWRLLHLCNSRTSISKPSTSTKSAARASIQCAPEQQRTVKNSGVIEQVASNDGSSVLEQSAPRNSPDTTQLVQQDTESLHWQQQQQQLSFEHCRADMSPTSSTTSLHRDARPPTVHDWIVLSQLPYVPAKEWGLPGVGNAHHTSDSSIATGVPSKSSPTAVQPTNSENRCSRTPPSSMHPAPQTAPCSSPASGIQPRPFTFTAAAKSATVDDGAVDAARLSHLLVQFAQADARGLVQDNGVISALVDHFLPQLPAMCLHDVAHMAGQLAACGFDHDQRLLGGLAWVAECHLHRFSSAHESKASELIGNSVAPHNITASAYQAAAACEIERDITLAACEGQQTHTAAECTSHLSDVALLLWALAHLQFVPSTLHTSLHRALQAVDMHCVPRSTVVLLCWCHQHMPNYIVDHVHAHTSQTNMLGVKQHATTKCADNTAMHDNAWHHKAVVNHITKPATPGSSCSNTTSNFETYHSTTAYSHEHRHHKSGAHSSKQGPPKSTASSRSHHPLPDNNPSQLPDHLRLLLWEALPRWSREKDFVKQQQAGRNADTQLAETSSHLASTYASGKCPPHPGDLPSAIELLYLLDTLLLSQQHSSNGAACSSNSGSAAQPQECMLQSTVGCADPLHANLPCELRDRGAVYWPCELTNVMPHCEDKSFLANHANASCSDLPSSLNVAALLGGQKPFPAAPAGTAAGSDNVHMTLNSSNTAGTGTLGRPGRCGSHLHRLNDSSLCYGAVDDGFSTATVDCAQPAVSCEQQNDATLAATRLKPSLEEVDVTSLSSAAAASPLDDTTTSVRTGATGTTNTSKDLFQPEGPLEAEQQLHGAAKQLLCCLPWHTCSAQHAARALAVAVQFGHVDGAVLDMVGERMLDLLDAGHGRQGSG